MVEESDEVVYIITITHSYGVINNNHRCVYI